MKTKNLLAFALMAMAVFLMPFGAVAQEVEQETAQEEPELTDPGITPDSPLYGLDKALDSIAFAMTRGSDSKVAKGLEIAEERLAEARAMALERKFDAMSEAESEHGKVLAEVKKEVKNIKGADSKEELKKRLEVEQKVEEYDDKVEAVKDELRVKIKIKGDITPEQQALIDSILASLKGQTGEVEIEVENEKGKTKIKIEQETGEAGDEVEDELEDELGITEKHKEDAQEKMDEVREDITELSAKAGSAGLTLSEETVAQINDLLSQAQTAFDAGSYESAKDLADQADDLLGDFEEQTEALIEEAEEKAEEAREAAEAKAEEAKSGAAQE